MTDTNFKKQLNSLNPRQLCSRFMKACSDGEVSLVSYMLDDEKINDILKKSYHNLAFQSACSNGQVEVVKIMIENYDNLNIHKSSGLSSTPVKNAKEICQLLVEDKNYPKNTLEILKDAVSYGHTKIVKSILTLKSIIEQNKDNHSKDMIMVDNHAIMLNHLLIYSCEKNHVEMIKFLLADKDMIKHADIHTENDFALNMACHQGNLELVKFLLTDSSLAEHANIHNQGDSPLLNACKARVEYFSEDKNPILGIYNDKMMDVIKYLTTSSELKEHANINAQNDYALILAFQNDDDELVKFLLNEPQLIGKIDVLKHVEELKNAHFQSWDDNGCQNEENLERDKDDDYNNDGVYNAKVLKYLIKEYGLASDDPKIKMEIDTILEDLPNLQKSHQYYVLQKNLSVNECKNKLIKI